MLKLTKKLWPQFTDIFMKILLYFCRVISFRIICFHCWENVTALEAIPAPTTDDTHTKSNITGDIENSFLKFYNRFEIHTIFSSSVLTFLISFDSAPFQGQHNRHSRSIQSRLKQLCYAFVNICLAFCSRARMSRFASNSSTSKI